MTLYNANLQQFRNKDKDKAEEESPGVMSLSEANLNLSILEQGKGPDIRQVHCPIDSHSFVKSAIKKKQVCLGNNIFFMFNIHYFPYFNVDLKNRPDIFLIQLP